MENAGVGSVGNGLDRCLRDQPVQRYEQRWWQCWRVRVIRDLLMVMTVRGAEAGGCWVKHAYHLVAVNRHAVCGCDSRRFNTEFEKAWARVSRHGHLREQDRGD